MSWGSFLFLSGCSRSVSDSSSFNPAGSLLSSAGCGYPQISPVSAASHRLEFSLCGAVAAADAGVDLEADAGEEPADEADLLRELQESMAMIDADSSHSEDGRDRGRDSEAAGGADDVDLGALGNLLEDLDLP